jgi:hypothetical protein
MPDVDWNKLRSQQEKQANEQALKAAAEADKFSRRQQSFKRFVALLRERIEYFRAQAARNGTQVHVSDSLDKVFPEGDMDGIYTPEFAYLGTARVGHVGLYAGCTYSIGVSSDTSCIVTGGDLKADMTNKISFCHGSGASEACVHVREPKAFGGPNSFAYYIDLINDDLFLSVRLCHVMDTTVECFPNVRRLEQRGYDEEIPEVRVREVVCQATVKCIPLDNQLFEKLFFNLNYGTKEDVQSMFVSDDLFCEHFKSEARKLEQARVAQDSNSKVAESSLKADKALQSLEAEKRYRVVACVVYPLLALCFLFLDWPSSGLWAGVVLALPAFGVGTMFKLREAKLAAVAIILTSLVMTKLVFIEFPAEGVYWFLMKIGLPVDWAARAFDVYRLCLFAAVTIYGPRLALNFQIKHYRK